MWYYAPRLYGGTLLCMSARACACMQFAVRVVFAVPSPRRQTRTVLVLYVIAGSIFHTDYVTELRLSWQRGGERVA